MSQRKFIFRGGSRELVLPVTPDSYRVETGVNIETINIHSLGDAVAVGYGTLATINISCMFPAHGYPFARDSDPESYISQLENWTKKKTKLRFIVGNTDVNIPVLIQSFTYGERDGTNDVYADLILREYRVLKAVRTIQNSTKSSSSNLVRAPLEKSAGSLPTAYPAKPGETISSISRKFFGISSDEFAGKITDSAQLIGNVFKSAATLNLREAAGSINQLIKLW